jgi:hypothetical protein
MRKLGWHWLTWLIVPVGLAISIAYLIVPLVTVGNGGSALTQQASPSGMEPTRLPAMLDPDPGLAPEEVVTYQLAVLESTGSGDDGIRQCYRFASPLNRAATGPIARFVKMVRSPPYDVMLRAADSLVGRAAIRDDQAIVLVSIIEPGRSIRVFRFFLARQRKPPFQDC